MYKVVSIIVLLFACSAQANNGGHKAKKESSYKRPSHHHKPKPMTRYCTTVIAGTFTPRNASTGAGFPGCPQNSSAGQPDAIFGCPTFRSFPPTGQNVAVTRNLYDCNEVAGIAAIAYGLTPTFNRQPRGIFTYRSAAILNATNPNGLVTSFLVDVYAKTDYGAVTASGDLSLLQIPTAADGLDLVITGLTDQYRKYDYDTLTISSPANGVGFTRSYLQRQFLVDTATNTGYVIFSIQAELQNGARYPTGGY